MRSIKVLCCFVIVSIAWAQLEESFSSETFPPEGWQIINYDGGNTWLRNSTNAHTPPGCAGCLWSEYYLTNDDWLVTPRLIVGEADTLKFYYRSASTTLESLEVRLSFKGPTVNNFTRTLWAKRFNNTSYQLAKIPLRSYKDSIVYIAFRYYVSYPLQPIGEGVYLDDITGPAIYQIHDVGVTQILAPVGVSIESIVWPRVRVKNFGSYPETIPVVFKIPAVHYEKHETTYLLAGNDTTIIFPSCTLGVGEYQALAYTVLDSDENNSNDTCLVGFIVRTHNVWQRRANFPVLVKTSGSSLCSDENGFIYGMRVSDTNFYAYDINNDNWSQKKSIPIKTKSGFGLVYGGDETIYVFTKNQKVVYRYAITTNTWHPSESLPIKPKTNTAFCRQNNHIYALLGDTCFYRYSLENNSWERCKGLPVKTKAGTALTGTTDGYLYAITGNKKAFHRYDPNTNSWTLLESAPWRIKKGAALSSNGNTVYALIGGRTKKFYCYQADMGWQELDSVPIEIKGGSSLAAAQGSIYALLGSTTNLFYRYLPEPSKHLSQPKSLNVLPQLLTIISSNKDRPDQLPVSQTVVIYNALGVPVGTMELAAKTQLHRILQNMPSGIYFIVDKQRTRFRLIRIGP
ncbi:MAG: choice-of-anchor J domain-containing protein [candidate division WOR-3 bacterium]